jgi:hypothetical protein
MISEETLDFTYEVLRDRCHDSRLQKMNAIVFLGIKPKGRAKNRFHPLSQKDYTELVNFCLDCEIISDDGKKKKGIPFGFDSCSAPKFEKAVKSSDLPEKKKTQLIQASESCESFGMFSSYINVHGYYFPCSFTENECNMAENGCGDWSEGLSALECEDFVRDIWNHPKVIKSRETSLKTAIDGCRQCLTFPEIN